MPAFVILAALMLAAALAFVLVPLLRHGRHRSTQTSTSRRERALDEALASGVIDADEYAVKRTALHQDGAQGTAVSTSTRRSRTTFATLLLLALLLPAGALLLYRLVGTPQALDPANVTPVTIPSDAKAGPEMEKAIALLVARLEKKPDDAEGWGLLGRSYQATERPDQALAAFQRAHNVAPDNAAASVELAQATAMARADHRIEGESRALLERVVAADPSNQRALWLLGISDYQNRDYDAAIARWRSLLPLLDPASTVATSVSAQIADAEALRDGKPSASAPTSPDTAGAQTSDKENTPDGIAAPAQAAHAPKLTVKVSLDPTLRDRLDPNATLFVFARAASGPPMPLAIQRLKASQLPLTVTLDDSMGMLPSMKLSMFPEVVIGARVSKSGTALPQSGDLQALSAPVDVHTSKPIDLTIADVVP